jgi:hypothetical protein
LSQRSTFWPQRLIRTDLRRRSRWAEPFGLARSQAWRARHWASRGNAAPKLQAHKLECSNARCSNTAQRAANNGRVSPPKDRSPMVTLEGTAVADRPCHAFDRRTRRGTPLRLIFAGIEPADAPGVPFDLGQSSVERGMRPLMNANHGFHSVALRVNRELVGGVLHDAPH